MLKEDKRSNDNSNAQFSGIHGLSAPAVLYDNIYQMADPEEQEIATTLTVPDRPASHMRVSRGRVANKYLYFVTFNDADSVALGGDLHARAITVWMQSP